MFYISTNLTHAASDGSTESYVTLPVAAKLNSVRLCPDVSTAQHASNYVTYSIADNAAATIFSATTATSGGAALTAGTPVAVTLSTAADYDFAAGEVVKIRVADNSGGASCAFTVVYEFAPARG